MTIYANRTGKDTLRAAFYDLAESIASVRLASPFFSYAEPIVHLAKRADVYLVVRLGPATHPGELRQLLEFPNVQIRYFTSPLFHTKLYLFGQKCALVGSANLTDAGMQRNREATVTILPGHPDFAELVDLYERYWSEAEVLDASRLEKYEALCAAHPRSTRDSALESAVVDAFGLVQPSQGIQTGVRRQPAAKLYLADYRRTYQAFESAFQEVEKVYSRYDRRRAPELPLRIEIDQFFNYVRDHHCVGSAYLEAPIRASRERQAVTHDLLEVWFAAEWPYLFDHIVPNFSIINNKLGSASSIRRLGMQDVLEALEVCHAFKDQRRFFRGGLPTLREDFLSQDDVHVKKSLEHLLHGDAHYIDRMGSLIFESDYKLRHCGTSVVQELLGWVNREDVPICNGRTLKVLRFIGHDLQTD